MNNDTISGKFDQAAGKVKQTVGEAVGNDRLANSGADNARANTSATSDSLRDGSTSTDHDVRNSVTSTAQNVKNSIKDKLDDVRRDR